MKSKLHIVILVCLLIFNYLSGANILFVKDTVVNINQYFDLEIELVNSDSIIAFQFDLEIPTSIQYLSTFYLSDRFADHQVSISQLDSVTWRVLCFSSTNSPIKNNNGTLIIFVCKASNRIGDFEVKLKNAILANIHSQNTLDSVKNGIITIMNPLKIYEEPENEGNLEPQIFPNPFNGYLKIRYFVQRLASVEIQIFDIVGEKIFQEKIFPGRIGWNEHFINFSNFNSGMYIVRVLDGIGNMRTPEIPDAITRSSY